MAPSAISTPENTNGAGNTAAHQPLKDDDEEHTSPRTLLYKNAYTHGYTEGYVKGYEQPANTKQMPIAIVGMSCRLPGNVSTPAEFWELLSRARTGWSEIPKERFESASFHHPNPGKSGCFNAVGGNFLKEDLGVFDAPFFSLTAQEATSMDPQQRILLECTFEALESAGIPKHEIVGKQMGVFVGGSFSEYESQSFTDNDSIPMYQATGCAFAMQSNRLSHFFDLRGPSFTMDTACSSSLVALHQACQSLRNGDLFSDEGRSFSFDSRGTGYGRGEGCGMVVLKPLDQALRDNDIIRSVIVGSGINQDGKTPGITMPNGAAQETLMRSVYQNAGIDPKDTGYVEAHGTGTKVGDPIEAAALHNVFGEGRTARNPLFIGSVKSNIGHLEAASGIISVIKASMMLERGFILPNYDFKKPNEKIPFAKWNLKVPISQRPWPRPKRFASVNNFGFGGTNSHVVLERAPFMKENEPDDSSSQARKLFVLSANDKNALEALMKNIGIYLEQRPEIFQNDLMSNVAYTLGQRRSLMQWRVAITTTSSFDLIQALNSGKISPSRETEPPRIGFIFTGQGAQWNAMGRELYDHYPIFKSTIDACDAYLVKLRATFSLVEELKKDAETSLVNEAHISQPACTAVQLALTELLRSWGVKPTAVAGHSSGEIGAAYAAGILPLDACMAISYYRGLVTVMLKRDHPSLKGSMMAVGCTKEEITPLIEGLTANFAKIACFNSPTSLTISGDEPAIDELQAVLEEKGIFNRKLQVDMAYHSHHMNLVAKEYRALLQELKAPELSSVKFYSSLLGHLVDGSVLEPNYWVDNLTQAVRFSEAVTTMCEPCDGHKTGISMLVEIGPHSALAGPIKQILKACGTSATKITYASTLVRKRDAVETAQELASILFVKGATLDLGAINLPNKPPSLLIDMPRYPWNHQTRYWHEPRMAQKQKSRTTARSDLLGTLANYSNDLEPTWRNVLRVDDLPWLRHHKVQSLTLFPMSGFISMAVEAASQRAILTSTSYDDFELRDVSVNTPLMLTDEDIEITLQLRPHQEGSLSSSDSWDEFRIHTWAAKKGWTEHCKGLIAVKPKTVECSTFRSEFQKLKSAGLASIMKADLYSSLEDVGVSYGPSFQGMNDCRASDNCSTADIKVVDTAQEMPQAHQTDSVIHSAFLEQLIEMYWPILGAGRKPVDTVYLPSSIAHMTISREVAAVTNTPGNQLQAFCKGSFNTSHPKSTQISMYASVAALPTESLIMIEDLVVSPIIEREMVSENEVHRELCYKLDWEPILQPLEDGLSNVASNRASEPAMGSTNGISDNSKAIPCDIADKIVVVRGTSEAQIVLASKLSDVLEISTGQKPEVGTLEEVTTDGKICLLISELDEPLLASLNPSQFVALQKVLTSVQGTLWVVRGAYVNSIVPDANMVTGLSRSIRSETLLKFATLDLDSQTILGEEDTAKAILRVLTATFGSQAEPNCELEYMEREGSFFTPRIINDAETNEYVHKQTRPSTLEPTRFSPEERPLKMVIGTPCALETLHFVDHSFEQALSNDEIEIQVKAIGMNPKDIKSINGQLETLELGYECSGIVSKVGNETGRFVVGDHIAGISISGGVYSAYTRLNAALCFKTTGTGVSFENAATLPIAYCTANYALFDLGRLQIEDKILIHGAESPSGQAAVLLAQTIGAEVFATVGSPKAKDAVMKSFDLPEDHVLSSLEASFSSRIHQTTTTCPFDIVLKCTSTDSDILRDLLKSLGSFGAFIELEKQSIHAGIGNSYLGSNRSFTSVDLEFMAIERPKLLARLISDVSKMLDRGEIKPLGISTIFSISNAEAAFKALQSGTVDGKIVVSPHADDEVKATPSSKHDRLLRADASYVLIGGTGGLGRSMARWMVEKGARNIVLVSRSGSATGKVKDLIDELGGVGANIVVRRCDVANIDSVQKLVKNELNDMPKIRGVVHGAMVLRDVLFEKMTHDQYTTVIESKVRGAWNFHNALAGEELDFFVAISSAAGAVGNRGQAAYSAANTFLNAFVQYRLGLGLPASSIDLTAVSDAGYLAENAEAAAEVSRNLGSDTICEAEVLALLGAAINGFLGRSCNHHTITGMRITADSPFWTTDAKFKHLRLAAEAVAAQLSDSQAKTISFNAALKAAKTIEEAEDVVCRGLLNKLPSVLMLEIEDMDVTRSLSNYALDSLVAIEVRNYITREFEANLQVLELLSSGSIETLAKTICIKSKLVNF
ncbi:Lovastatin diketide synthase LovF 16 [Phlyctema vagabunda]|uniref:Lovastatin diketide synthase LovF 16 n=1 Tax=Phlyctema vagabunda TaxID=108571 RepID=A0ABR4PF11_9HELO